MLVSGGKILAIDQVYTDNETILGDGVQKPLGVNTDVIATNTTVSSVSAKLEQNIDYVSGHLPAVSAGKNVGVELSATPDGRPLYIVSADDVEQRDIHIIGDNGVSAVFNETTSSWNIGVSADYVSADTLNNYYNKTQVDDKLTNTSSWANDTFQKKGNYVSASDFEQFKTDVNDALETKQDVSAMSAYAQSAWVNDNYQKKGNYVSADDFDEYKTQVSQEFANTSSWANETFQEKGDYVSATEFNEYKEQVDDEFESTSAWANDKFQEKGDYVSATEFDDYKTEVSQEFTNTSSWANATFQEKGDYVSASDFEDYKELVEQTFTDTSAWANETFQTKGDYLSANALDEVSGAWNDVVHTVETYSAAWNEVSAYSATSGQFVTSSTETVSAGLANVLVKDENDNVTWSGVDLSKLGKIYGMSSQTPDLLTVGISADEETNEPIYVLSAAAPEQVSTPDISGYGLSAWKDTDINKYFISANIAGQHGVSAKYDDETNTWQLGISANDYGFLFGSYVNDTTITDGTILKLESNNKHLINIDEDGYITLPETTNKFTFCINEYVDDNTTENHEYLLNKLVLSAKNNDPIVASQSYYPSEVGSSNVTLAITVDNTAATDREFCIVYKGSDVGTNKLHINASILEEVTSLDSTAGSVDDYTGINPIYVVDNDRQIGLGWDETVFKLTEADELGRRKLTIDAGSETVDAQKFQKMAELIDTRMTETFPIGLTCDEGDIGANCCVSYMFRPTMSYDLTSATSAYIYHGNDDGQTQARIGIYKINDSSAELLWKSALSYLTPGAGAQDVLIADTNSPSGTLSTEGLYYACILTNQSKSIIKSLGIATKATGSVGVPRPWAVRSNINNNTPFVNQDFSAQINGLSEFGEFNTTIKPYIGFRGTI